MRPHNFRDLTGQRFDRLEVVRLEGTGPKTRWLVRCDCGGEKVVSTTHLTTGHTRSCGCLKRKVSGDMLRTHGLSRTPAWFSWISMRVRCNNPNAVQYAYYGGRGITVCERWSDSFENFLADMGQRPSGCTLDRLDPNGNYEPSNCRWATDLEQQRNRRPRRRKVPTAPEEGA